MLLTYHGSSKWAALHASPPAAFVASACVTHSCCVSIDIAARRLIILDNRNTPCVRQAARRRGRYVEEEGEEEDEDGEYGYNAEIAMLEAYSRSAREEALLVKAVLDDREEQILIFKDPEYKSGRKNATRYQSTRNTGSSDEQHRPSITNFFESSVNTGPVNWEGRVSIDDYVG